jgi:glycosyltransferase involved in cell wall biosynthesis
LPNEFLVLFVGRAIPAKGVDILLDSIPLFNKKIKVLIISTSGPYVDLIRQAALKNPNILFINGCNYSNLPSYYAAADLFIAPSRSEDAPRTIVEALACGTPAVGTRIGGIPSVLTDKIGKLVNLNSIDIADSINYIYSHPAIYKSMKDNCRVYALNKFSIKNAELFSNIYLKLTE